MQSRILGAVDDARARKSAVRRSDEACLQSRAGKPRRRCLSVNVVETGCEYAMRPVPLPPAALDDGCEPVLIDDGLRISCMVT